MKRTLHQKTSSKIGASKNSRRGGGGALLLIICAAFAACTGNAPTQGAGTPERKSPAPVAAAPDPVKHDWSGVVQPNAEADGADRVSAEAGFGVKSEADIMKERPRAARIAVLGPMSGELESYGQDAVNGAELAADEINAAGGIRGQEFDLLVYDTKGSVVGAQKGVETLLAQESVAIVGAATGEVSFSANKMLNENQLIMISAGSRRRLGDTGPYNFRLTLNDAAAIRSLAGYLDKTRGYKKYALISSVVNDYSIQLNATFKAELLARGKTISHELYVWGEAMTNINPEERGIDTQIKQLAANPPDAVVFTGDGAEAAQLVTAMAAQGLSIPLVGPEDLMSADFDALKEKAVGTVIYSGFDPGSANPRAAAFVASYRKRFGATPNRLAALSYDTYRILAHAIDKSASMRPSHVRAALEAVRQFPGVTGTTSFNATREAEKEPYLLEFKKNGSRYGFVGVKEPS